MYSTRLQTASHIGPSEQNRAPRSIWSELVARHFVVQDRRPPDVREARLDALDGGLRSLLLSDGSITRALEARALRRVVVSVLDQRPAKTPAEAARFLPIVPDERCLRRRVAMSFDESPTPAQPFAYAESHLVPRLLPACFSRALSTAGGIGYALQEAGVESRRELLWFGVRDAPAWARAVGGREHVVRSYRIVIGGQAAVYIFEALSGMALGVAPS
jgi:chorismate-pyruvate lyase